MNRRALLIVGGAFAALAILAVLLLVLPKLGQVGEAQDELTTARDQENALLVQLGVLQDAQAGAPEIEREIALLDAQVPPTADLPTLIRLLQAAASRSTVDFFQFTPGSPQPDPSGAFSRIPSQITVNGTYFAVDEFFFLLETLERASKVTSWTISPFSGEGTGGALGENALQMQVTVEFYTTDVSAGPGSTPGATEGVPTAPVGPTGATAGAGVTAGEG